jgi:hypothetical protein
LLAPLAVGNPCACQQAARLSRFKISRERKGSGGLPAVSRATKLDVHDFCVGEQQLRRKLNVIRLILALTIAMIALCIANLIAPVQAEVVIQSEAAPPKTNFSASPITAGFWQFSNKKNANINEISKGCQDYVTFQFQDGYYFTLSMKKHQPGAKPRWNSAIVQEVGRCAFDPDSQIEHCDLTVTEDSGATNKGFIDIRYSSENGALKMIVRATITEGSNAGNSETFERFPIKCPDNIVHDLMTVTPSRQ